MDLLKLQAYQKVENGKLLHQDIRYDTLAQTYGTPLYIIDETSLRKRITDYKKALETPYFETQVLYASKALLTVAIGKIIAELGIGQDVVSAGEIYTGVQSGIKAEKMYFHGNNKLDEELEFAVEQNVGTVVLDNRHEAQRLNRILEKYNKKQKVLLRLNPGVEAHTHEYIKTANLDSKFGESIFDPEILAIIQEIDQASQLDFAGFHSHIGSQIFDSTSFIKAAEELILFAHKIQNQLDISIREINFGGGFGVYYTAEDQPFDIEAFLPDFVEFVHQKSQELGIQLEKITIEPGRSLINDSGSTLYTIGDIKQTVGGKKYLFVDGSMNDNIRPALYQAKYEAALVDKIEQEPIEKYTVAGKACESGDIIIDNIKLGRAQSGDLLLVNGTGAYNYSMASNYNHIPIPAMIHIHEGESKLTVKRQTPMDIIRNNIQ